MLLTPKEEVYHRIGRLQKELNSANVDGFLILQNVNLFYFSGTMQNSVMFVPRKGEPLLLVKRSLTRAQIESPLANIVPYTHLTELPHALSTLLEKPLTKLYLELDVLPARIYLWLKELFSGVEFVNGSEPVRKLRMIKSRFEIEQMQKAAEIARAVYSEIPSLIQPGMREIDLSAELEARFRKMGHQGLVRAHRWDLELYYGAVISGANMSYPVPFEGPDGGMGLSAAVPQGAGEKPIQEGEPIMVDMVVGYNGYMIDKTRVYALGRLPEDLLKAHRFALEVQKEMTELLRPGNSSRRIYQTVMKKVEQSPYRDYFMGYGDNKVRFVAHGIGCEIDELPLIAEKPDLELQPGMTLAVEPKIFFPQKGGVGIENTWLITEDRPKKLTDFPDELHIL